MGSGISNLPTTVNLSTLSESSRVGDHYLYQKLKTIANDEGIVTKEQLMEWSSSTADDVEKEELISAFHVFQTLSISPRRTEETTTNEPKSTDLVSLESSCYSLDAISFTESQLEAIIAIDVDSNPLPFKNDKQADAFVDHCKSCKQLALTDVRISRRFANDGMCENLIHAIRLNCYREVLVRESLNALVIIATDDEHVLRQIGGESRTDDDGFVLVNVMQQILKIYPKNPMILDDVYKLLWLVCLATENCEAYGTWDMIELTHKTIAPYCQVCDEGERELVNLHASLVENYFRVVSILVAGHIKHRAALGRALAHDLIVDGMKLFAGRFDVQYHGIKALMNLTENDATNRNFLGNNPQYVKVLYYVLENYGGMSEVLVEDSLCLIAQICESEKFRRRLGDGGMGEQLHKAMTTYPDSRTIAVLGCKTTAMLLIRMPDERVKMGNMGFCEIVVKLLEKYQLANDDNIAGQVDSGLRCKSLVVRESLEMFENTNDELIAAHACDAIAYLALGNQLNKTRLREAGALVVVMEALRGFCRSLFVVERGCRAVCELAKDNDINKTLLGEHGIVEFLMIAVKAHNSSANMCEQCLRAVVFLTQDHPHNREHFGTLAACSLFIVDAMRCHLDYHIIAEWGCLAMANLAVDSPTNIFNLDSVGAAATVYGAIMTHNVVQGVLIAACKAIVLLTKNPSFLGRIKLLGMGEKLQNILESEKSGKDVRLWTSNALVAIAKQNSRRMSLH